MNKNAMISMIVGIIASVLSFVYILAKSIKKLNKFSNYNIIR